MGYAQDQRMIQASRKILPRVMPQKENRISESLLIGLE